MQTSVSTFLKPIQHVALDDWLGKQSDNHQTNDTRRNDAFNLRYEARQLRSDTRIRTEWNTYHTNAKLADRVIELSRWKETLETCLAQLNQEIKYLKEEKFETETDVDNLGIPIAVVSECITVRDERQGAELTYDEAESELKKELCVMENAKNMLINRCKEAWEKLNRLDEVKFQVQLHINDKLEALESDKEVLALDRHCSNIGYKTDPMRIPKDSVPYVTWLQQSRCAKLSAEAEMAASLKLREALFTCRERSRNDIMAQREVVDFTLRKRIYLTQRGRNELDWQLLKMRAEMDRVAKEIATLEEALRVKDDALKLCETRLETRTYRPGLELARDEAGAMLNEECVQLRHTRRELDDKIDRAKSTFNALENRRVVIAGDLANKDHSFMTDIKCLDLRARLKPEVPLSETDRNFELVRLEQQISPE